MAILLTVPDVGADVMRNLMTLLNSKENQPLGSNHRLVELISAIGTDFDSSSYKKPTFEIKLRIYREYDGMSNGSPYRSDVNPDVFDSVCRCLGLLPVKKMGVIK